MYNIVDAIYQMVVSRRTEWISGGLRVTLCFIALSSAAPQNWWKYIVYLPSDDSSLKHGGNYINHLLQQYKSPHVSHAEYVSLTAIISLNYINLFAFLMQTDCVLCDLNNGY